MRAATIPSSASARIKKLKNSIREAASSLGHDDSEGENDSSKKPAIAQKKAVTVN